jgi:DNA-binding protein HU-beta
LIAIIKDGYMQKVMSKSELTQQIAERCNGLKRDDVRLVLDALVEVGHAELKSAGTFTIPGFAKFVAIEKPATQAHQGVNPFSKEPMMIEAKPAHKVVKVRLLKVVKDAVASGSAVEGDEGAAETTEVQ